MATDRTELTFIRCPSCRSLVPALSKACRMCGASLDGVTKGEEQEKKSGRVRQRTMSQPQEVISATVNKIREELKGTAGAEVPNVEPAFDNAPAEPKDVPFDDPLSAYVEEVYGAGDQPAKNGTEVPHSTPEPQRFDAPTAEEPASQGSDEQDPLSAFFDEEEALPEQEPDFDFNVGEAEPDEEPAAPPAMPKRVEPAPEEPARPKVLVESGPRRQTKGGLNFGKPKPPAPQAAEPPKPVAAPVAAAPAEPQEPEPEMPPKVVREEVFRKVPVPVPTKKPMPVRVEEERRPKSEPPVAAGGVHGRLWGWLVSYTDPDGNAVEMREGKCFVSRESVKEADLVIDHPSVSKPHALLTVGAQHGVQIQDLLSETGVFVRTAGDDVYRRIDDSSELNHGDWVRFGEVEFLLCLVAHVGEK